MTLSDIEGPISVCPAILTDSLEEIPTKKTSNRLTPTPRFQYHFYDEQR
jgi:hypothetical protein